MNKRNPMAECLSNGAYRPQTVKPKKGKGSYSRKKWIKNNDY